MAKPPQGESAGNFVVGEEVAGNLFAADICAQIEDVMDQIIVGLTENIPFHLGRDSGVAIRPRSRRGFFAGMPGEGGSRRRDKGEEQTEKYADKAAGKMRASWKVQGAHDLLGPPDLGYL